MTYLTTALVTALALVTGPFLALAMSAPTPGDVAFVITPPWVDAVEATQRGGGRPVGLAQMPLGVLAVYDSPDFPADVRTAGAWWVIDGRAIADFCGVDT